MFLYTKWPLFTDHSLIRSEPESTSVLGRAKLEDISEQPMVEELNKNHIEERDRSQLGGIVAVM